MNNLYKLFKIQCIDLLCLLEMERAGVYFDSEEALKYAEELDGKQRAMLETFYNLVGNRVVNIASNDHISTILYGGIILEPAKVAIGHFKTGARIGKIKYSNVNIEHKFERLVVPLAKTETKKSTEDKQYYQVNEPTLRSLKATGKAKEIINILLEYSKMEKLRGTYLVGYSELIKKMNWEHNMLHPSYNQCVAITGRLSSSNPNGQNMDKTTKKFMSSRYEN